MKYSIITSFGLKGYEQYGKRFIETFEQYWPKEVTLYVYHEGSVIPDLSNVRSMNLFAASEDCCEFLTRHQKSDLVKGRKVNQPHKWKNKAAEAGYNFRYDAWKFCRKVFAIAHAAKFIGSGKLFWVDADIVTFDRIPLGLLDSMLPLGYHTCYLGRERSHSECGFVGYNLDSQRGRLLIEEFAELYATDKFLIVDEWHDSYVYDYMRKVVGTTGYNISAGVNGGHVFINSILGRYMDHMKGPDRKERGKSFDYDLKTIHSGVEYWQQ